MDELQTRIEVIINQPYKTIGRRILANLIDLGINSIFCLALLGVYALFHVSDIYFVNTTITTLALLIYTLILTKVYGGTIGKLFCNLQVLDNKTEGKIGWRHSIMRKLIDIIFAGFQIIPMFIYSINHGNFSSKQYSVITTNPVFIIVNISVCFFYLIDIIAALSSDKKRALHDLIGGTVVKIVAPYRPSTWAVIIFSFIAFGLFMYFGVKANL